MALNFETQSLRKELKISERKLNKVFGLLIASQKEPDMDSAAYRDKKLNEKYKQINNPKRPTEGQLLGGKKPTYTEEGPIDTGELSPDGSRLMIKGMPPAIDPEEHKRLQKQKKIRGIAEEGATEGERQAGRGKLKDQTQLPNFLKIVIDSKPNPADLLKILQLLPAFTGGGLGQMANMKDSLQRENVGGTLRDVMLPLLIKEYGKDGSGGYKNPGALLSGMKKLAQLPANNIRRLQDTGHMTIPQNPDGTGPLRIIDLLGPQNPPQA